MNLSILKIPGCPTLTALNCNQSSGKEAVAVNQKINLIFDTFWITRADVSLMKNSKKKIKLRVFCHGGRGCPTHGLAAVTRLPQS